jgi:glutamate racemase
VLLFNVIGYRMVFSYLEKEASQELTASIETKNFDESNLIEIKTELNMPYVSDKDYENAYGETVIKGVHYQYVKRKIENNVLYLMCLSNDAKTVLAETKNNVEKNNAEAGNTNSKHKSPVQKILKSTQIEYIQNHHSYQLDDMVMITSSTLLSNRNNRLSSLFSPLTPKQPPECFA